MSVTTYVGTSSQIWYWSLHVLVWGVHFPFAIMNNIEQWRGHSVVWQISPGGSICLWYLYVYICTGISLYFLISWLFRMGSHLSHWTAKSLLCAQAVLNGGSIISFTQVKLAMWNCRSWPPDVINNLSVYFISNLVLVTSCVSTGGRSICLLYIYALYLILEWHWFGVPVCKAAILENWGGWGGVYLPYIYMYCMIYKWHSFGVPVCKASMFARLGGLSASYIYVLYWIYKWHWFGVLVCKASMLNRQEGSVAKWNCHSWPLDVSSNVKLPFLTTKCK